LHRSLCGPQKPSGCGGEEIKSHHCPCRESIGGRPIYSSVSILADGNGICGKDDAELKS